LFQNVRVRGFDSLKIRSVLKYITDLKAENNDEIGHYGQTLITYKGKSYKPWFWVFSRRRLEQIVGSKNPGSRIKYIRSIKLTKY